MEFIGETYKKSYLQTDNRMTGIATARASNVIGGGDHIQTRLIPSILTAFAKNQEIPLRNPQQTRPWQSVLDALNGYLSIARLLHENPGKYSSPWNIGPAKDGIRSVLDVVEKMRRYYAGAPGYTAGGESKVLESKTLGLDITKALSNLDWGPELTLDKMLYALVDYFKRQRAGEAERDICLGQVRDFFITESVNYV
jgi:CDP-glucose 4,6-dehydratase